MSRLLLLVLALAPAWAGPQRGIPDLPQAEIKAAPAEAAVGASPAAALPSLNAIVPQSVPTMASLPATSQAASADGEAPSAQGQALGVVADPAASFDGAGASRVFADESVSAVFKQLRPGSKSLDVLERVARLPMDTVIGEIFYGDAFAGQRDPASIFGMAAFLNPALPRAALELLELGDRAATDPGARRLIVAAARQSARDHYKSGIAEDLPDNPLGTGEYWDLATGPNGMRLMRGRLDPKTSYKFFERSPYVMEFLRESKRMMEAQGRPASNVELIQADVRRLARPPTPLAVIRYKNVHAYVKGYEKNIDAMADWIAPGGALFIENDPHPGQRLGISGLLGPMIDRLLAEGWTFEFGGISYDRDRLERISLRRPSVQSKPDARSAKAWKRYQDDIQRDLPRGETARTLARRLYGSR